MLPVEPQVVAGNASFEQNDNVLTVVIFSSSAIINWQEFNIGAYETVRFILPTSSSTVLNRVLSSWGPMKIYGELLSNGNVCFSSLDGIHISAGAMIYTAEFNVGTSISNTDFLASGHINGGFTASGPFAGEIYWYPNSVLTIDSPSFLRRGQLTGEFSVSDQFAVSDQFTGEIDWYPNSGLIINSPSVSAVAVGDNLSVGGSLSVNTSAEIVSTSDAGSIGNISLGGALTNTASEALTSSTTVSTDTATLGGTVSVSGTTTVVLATHVADVTISSGTFSITPDLGELHAIRAYSWKSHTVLNSVSLQPGGDSTSLVPVRDVSAEETTTTGAAVDLNDAIAILKMVVGLGVNDASQPLSPYQAIAADFDGNGAVSLTDAIGVLKHVVGLETALPSWLFVNETDPTTPARASLNPGMLTATIDTNSTTNTSIGLVGILRGDVDGSWTGSAGSQTLPADYFLTLGGQLGVSTSQWGIYP